MNLPSRGLRPSATTMRNAGLFFAPTRQERVLVAVRKAGFAHHFPAAVNAVGVTVISAESAELQHSTIRRPDEPAKHSIADVPVPNHAARVIYSVSGAPVSARQHAQIAIGAIHQ